MYLISSHFDSLKAFSKACNNKQTQPFVIYVRYLQYFCLSRHNFTRFASLFPAFPVFHHIFAHASKIIPPIRPWNNFSRTVRQNHQNQNRQSHGILRFVRHDQSDYLKVVSSTVLLVYFSNPKQCTYETWKNVFYLPSKALLVLEKIKF